MVAEVLSYLYIYCQSLLKGTANFGIICDNCRAVIYYGVCILAKHIMSIYYFFLMIESHKLDKTCPPDEKICAILEKR